MATGANLTIYGFPEECKNFDERHPLWNEMIGNLVTALNVAFTRVEDMTLAADKFVYFFGRVIYEDSWRSRSFLSTVMASLRPSSCGACTS